MQGFVGGKDFLKIIRPVPNPPIVQSNRFHGLLRLLVNYLTAEAGSENKSKN
jgi:hypothetical protein